MKLTLYLCLRISEPIHETTQRRLETSLFLRGIAQARMVRFFSFLSPYANELRTGIREKNQRRRKPRPRASAENDNPLGAP